MKKKNVLKFVLALSYVFLCLPNNNVNAQGPTAPEAASFEPVDATDMVNLVSGDLSYVLPLLEVPSPEGGYPLTLSYHAGIAIDQEASWVGLGWNINPGAINRGVTGFPDDWKEVGVSSIAYDIGGEVSYHNFSIGVGWGDGKYSAGLYGSYAENKAFGGKNSYSFDMGIYGSIDDVSANIGSGGIGLTYSNTYSNIGKKAITRGNYSIGLNYSFKTGGTSLSASADFKISSTGTATGTSARTTFNGSVGISAVHYTGSNRGNHNSKYSETPASDAWDANLTAGILKINYSYSKIRYWYFDKKTYTGVGALYAKNITDLRNEAIFEDQVGFDTYTANYDQTTGSLFDNSIVLPAYDFYSVSAQGLAGDISPKIFEYGTLTPKRTVIGHNGIEYDLESYNKDSFSRDLDQQNIHFYFNNVNESFLDIDANSWGVTPSTVESITQVTSPSSLLTSSINIDGVDYDNYNPIKRRKKSASFIETYTNEQIISNQNLVYNPPNFARDASSIPVDGIGAFKITSPDGKTYHYSLPVYQKEKFSRSAKYNEDINNKFYEEYQTEPYATHWLLTAITGSDYVDDGNGTISENDLGYWVVFDYGKWSDGYTWRTPKGTDFRTTHESKVYEWGVKEVYYLNTVKTRTHTAFFVKSEREDGESIPDSMDREFESITLTGYKCRQDADTGAWYFNGVGINSPVLGSYDITATRMKHTVKMNYDRKAHKLLKLDKIIVVKNNEIPNNFSYSNPNETSGALKVTIGMSERALIFNRDESVIWPNNADFTPIYNSSWSGEFYNNILDANDISYYFPNIQDTAIKSIELNQDYSLAGNTPNGINSTTGRLTLKKLNYKEKTGIQLLPGYSFEYENPYKTYNSKDVDAWGFTKNYETAWNLKKITQPTGASLLIDYEQDDYFVEAAKSQTMFKNGLQFVFYNFNGNLRIDVENVNSENPNNINFLNFYDLNQQAKVNIWACIRHEYWQLGCQSRNGYVDIENEYIDVVSVNSNSVTFETTLSDHTYNHEGGLGMIFDGRVFSYDMDELQSKERGQCPDLSGGCPNKTSHTLYYSIDSNKTLVDQNGGGLRVKQITVNSEGKNYHTNYFYNQNGFDKNKTDANYKSSGITSYSPSIYNKNIKYLSELPPPSVLYSSVTVQTESETNTYTFKTLTPEVEVGNTYSIGDILHIEKTQNQDGIPINVTSNSSTNTVSKYKYVVKNNFSMLGKLLVKERYNNASQLLRKVTNNYTSTSNILQGLNKETFNSFNSVYRKSNGNNYRDFNLNISSKITYPSVLENTKVISDGNNSMTYFDKYDFNTGQVLETRTVSSDGLQYKTKTVPAYTKYLGMGSKVDDPINKNMLTQQAASYSYLIDPSTSTLKMTGAAITTWNNIWNYRDISGAETSPSNNDEKIWRKHRSYFWKGDRDADGAYIGFNEGNDDGFDWGVGVSQSPSSKWKWASETTRYDHYSMPLESKDINENYATTKTADNHTKVIAVANAKYTEAFYSGAEYNENSSSLYLEPEIRGANLRTSSKAHTGRYSVRATPGSQLGVDMRSGEHRAGRYKLSVWVLRTNYEKARVSISGLGTTAFNGETSFAGDWVLMNHYFTIGTGNTSVYLTSGSGDVYYDDLRIHPIEASMTSYVYNELDEVSYIIGASGLGVHYVYDKAGRLTETWSEILDNDPAGITGGFKKVQQHSYNYKNQ